MAPRLLDTLPHTCFVIIAILRVLLMLLDRIFRFDLHISIFLLFSRWLFGGFGTSDANHVMNALSAFGAELVDRLGTVVVY